MNFVHENAVNLIQYNLCVLLLFLKTDTESGSDPTTLKTAGNQLLFECPLPALCVMKSHKGLYLERYSPPCICPLQDAIARHNLESLFYGDDTQLNISIDPTTSLRLCRLPSKFV